MYKRQGRDYLKVGQVMEVLRQRGIRLIAINDGVDSLKGDDDFTPVSYTHLLENIEYDCLKQRYPLYLDDLNEIVELLVETVLSLIHILCVSNYNKLGAVFIFVKEGKIMQEKEKGGFSFINEQIKDCLLYTSRCV